eukprot:evm.model.NODE_37460_length_6741_cov_20.856104.1
MTQEIHQAWLDTITFIATVMIEGGKEEEESVRVVQEERKRKIRRMKEEEKVAAVGVGAGEEEGMEGGETHG